MAITARTGRKRPTLTGVSLGFVAVAAICLFFSDMEISTIAPWHELRLMAYGVVTPDFFKSEHLGQAILYTLSFAFIGVGLAAFFGFWLTPLFEYRFVRLVAAFIRAIHELFWALIFLQIFGLSPITGVLAIAIPYTGVFVKVYSEILEEADQRQLEALPAGTGRLSTLLYAKIPDAWGHLVTYTFYRLECGIRSSAVLGFVGLPTLGYHLESAFAQGRYSEVSALLFIFYLVIGTMRYWMGPRVAPLYLIAAFFALPGQTDFAWVNVKRFLTIDIVPAPLRHGGDGELISWIVDLSISSALPGAINTVLLTMIALVATGVMTLIFFPLISNKFFGWRGRFFGHLILVVGRSTPEYILAFLFLTLWGPSMLPAVAALCLHNGAIIGHLVGRHTDTLEMRQDSPGGLNLYFYDVAPRIYTQFLAFLFYRWEVIMRETSILGMLGIATLGFYVDSAFADIRFDRALFLILITALLNIAVDAVARQVRHRLQLRTTPDRG